METPPVEQMALIAQPQILVPSNEETESLSLSRKESQQSLENKLKSTSEVTLAQPQILVSSKETHHIISNEETERLSLSRKESPQSLENKLKSTSEVFDLTRSTLETASSKDHKVSENDSEQTGSLATEEAAVDESPSPTEKASLEPQLFTSPSLKKTVLEEHGFAVGNLIGSGTYAKVKVAYSAEYKGTVAIKIISKMKAPSEYLSRFLPREIEVVKGLRHENLIKFYQSIETTHRVYIIMQLAEKGSLLDLIRKEKHLEDSQTRKYYQQLINVLDYCHSKGVVHRDIKCENLLLDQDMNLKLIDFGFARGQMLPVNNTPVLSDTYCGSYAYASPEILKGIPYDPHNSDIWASGVVLYAMAFGHLPYDGSNYNQLLKQVQAKLILPKSPADVPLECRHLILKILAPLKVRYKIRQIKIDKWYCN